MFFFKFYALMNFTCPFSCSCVTSTLEFIKEFNVAIYQWIIMEKEFYNKLYWQFIQGTFSNKIQITHLYFSILLFYCFAARKCGFLFNVYQGRKGKCMSTGLKCTFFCANDCFFYLHFFSSTFLVSLLFRASRFFFC